MYNWEYDVTESRGTKYLGLILFSSAAVLALVLYLIFHPQIAQINSESAILLNIMFGPSLAIGFLYGRKITQKAVIPGETRSPFKRTLVKILLFFFVIGGLFSAVNFAINEGSVMPLSSILDVGLIPWVTEYVNTNGGATFLIISSITLMASATKKIVGLDGTLNRIVSFVGTFIFFSMLALSFTQTNPSHSEVYLYTFYQAGIIGGALYEMNRLTRNLNFYEDYSNGYL